MENQEIEIIQEKISEDHNDSVWYDGIIAEVLKSNGTRLRLIAAGEIRIYERDGDIVFDGYKERNGGIEGGFKSDKDLEKIGCNYDDKYYWDMNNWFEVMYKQDDDEYWESSVGDVAHEYDEAIDLLKAYMEDDRF